MSTSLARAVTLLAAFAAAGCTTTLGVVDPRPNAMVVRAGAPYAIDLSRVPDSQPFQKRVIVEHLRESIERGFRNAVGSMYGPPGPGAFVLVVDEATIEPVVLWQLDPRHLIDIRYRARWRLPDGRDLVEVAGVAYPRRTFDASRAEVLEDTLLIMLHGMISALDDALRRMPAPAWPPPATLPPPALPQTPVPPPTGPQAPPSPPTVTSTPL